MRSEAPGRSSTCDYPLAIQVKLGKARTDPQKREAIAGDDLRDVVGTAADQLPFQVPTGDAARARVARTRNHVVVLLFLLLDEFRYELGLQHISAAFKELRSFSVKLLTLTRAGHSVFKDCLRNVLIR